MKPKIIAIVGPTASGKSDYAINIARERNGELVSADSRQVYIGMDIVTAKLIPPKDVKQWLVDVAEPDETFTLADYQKLAFEAIDNILERNKLPILVGGTGMYIDAVTENWLLPEAINKFKVDVQNIIKNEGLESAVKLLKEKDPASANTIDVNNPRRVSRALEYVMSTGESFVHAQSKGAPKYEVEKIGLHVEPRELRQRMFKRVERMFENGAVEETERLLKKYPLELPSMSGIGYKEIKLYIDGVLTKEKAIEKITIASYQYSRRQMTWWKRDKNIKWIKVN